jgi:hypothetical protein
LFHGDGNILSFIVVNMVARLVSESRQREEAAASQADARPERRSGHSSLKAGTEKPRSKYNVTSVARNSQPLKIEKIAAHGSFIPHRPWKSGADRL